MTLCKKMINLLILVLGIQNSLQTNYFPIIEALNITNPYYVMDTFDFKSKDLIKHHFNKSEFAMLCHSIEDIPIKNKEDIQSIIKFTKNVDDIKTILEPLLDFHFPTIILLITNSSQKANLKNMQILIHQQILFYFEDDQELYEAYFINNLSIIRHSTSN